MKKFKIKPSLVVTALLLSLVTLAFNLVLVFFPDQSALLTPLAFIIFFALSYVIVKSSIKNLVSKRISTLYKLISNTSKSDSELKNSLKNTDPILEFTKDFDEWANARSSEIMQLTEMEKYRKEFLGNVSHELKTPLFNIQGYIFTLLDGGLEDKKINRKYLERTDKSIDRLISIVKDLESISAIETGNLELKKKNFDLIPVIKDVFEMQELRSKKLGIKLKLKIKPGQQIIVTADKKQITQVLINLVVNAVNYGKEKGNVKVSFSEYDRKYCFFRDRYCYSSIHGLVST